MAHECRADKTLSNEPNNELLVKGATHALTLFALDDLPLEDPISF